MKQTLYLCTLGKGLEKQNFVYIANVLEIKKNQNGARRESSVRYSVSYVPKQAIFSSGP